MALYLMLNENTHALRGRQDPLGGLCDGPIVGEVEVHQAWYRENMGRIFNLCLRILGLTHIPDTQCGFKGFTAAACETVLARQTIEGFAFDAELLFIAEKQGLRIEQVPVRWVNSRKSRLNPVTDSAAMFWEILRIRINSWLGKYT